VTVNPARIVDRPGVRRRSIGKGPVSGNGIDAAAQVSPRTLIISSTDSATVPCGSSGKPLISKLSESMSVSSPVSTLKK
jgi:hypothetical protein